MSISNLFAYLNLSQETKDLITNTKYEDLKSVVSKICINYLDDSYILAGRITMFYHLSRIEPTVERYLELLSHRLSSDYIKFMQNNKEKINLWIQQNKDWSYSCARDLISAQKWIFSNLMSIGFNTPAVEHPEFLNIRVAWQQYKDDLDKVLSKAKEMNLQYYTHASPTLFNSGSKYCYLGSCFQITSYDDTESIQENYKNIVAVTKGNGGIGVEYTRLRNSSIGYTGNSKGAIAQAKIGDSMIGCWDQGGLRNGAKTSYIRDWHLDAMNFAEVVTSDADPSIAFRHTQSCIWISDLLFERAKRDENWTLFCPSKVPKIHDTYNDEFEKNYVEYEKAAKQAFEKYKLIEEKLEKDPNNPNLYSEKVHFQKNELIMFKTVKARDFLNHIVNCQLRDGPYIMNGDSINFKSQVSNIGPINGSNLCTEIVQPTGKKEIPTCNLGSLNLPKFVKSKLNYIKKDNATTEDLCQVFDFDLLGKMTYSLAENINYVIDNSFYPLDVINPDGTITRGDIAKTNYRNRPMGIGVSGLYNCFTKIGLPFDSQAAKLLNKMIFACMYYNCCILGVNLAKIYGSYETFNKGEFKLYYPEKDEFVMTSGSPWSNGLFQFDLWKLENQYLQNRNRLYNQDEDGDQAYDQNCLDIISPKDWGQSGDWEQLRTQIMTTGIRNSLYLAPMPTASTANIMSNVGAFEAPVGLIYSKTLKDVNAMYVVPEFLEYMKDPRIVWNKEVLDFIIGCDGSIRFLDRFYEKYYPDVDFDYVSQVQDIFRTAFEISQRDILLMSQARGVYVDQSQSLNIFFKDPSAEKLIKVLELGYSMRLKTLIYYLRQANPIKKSKLSLPLELVEFIEQLEREELEQEYEDEDEDFCYSTSNLSLSEKSQDLSSSDISEDEDSIPKIYRVFSGDELVSTQSLVYGPSCTLGKDCVSCTV